MKSPRPAMIHRAHGKPMLCPVCEGDVYADAPHVCAPGFVMPAAAGTVLTFYAYNSTNQCCRDWMLLGWPEVDGSPRWGPIEGNARVSIMRFDCPKCGHDQWYDLAHPDAVARWDVRAQGTPDPPTLVAGRIRSS